MPVHIHLQNHIGNTVISPYNTSCDSFNNTHYEVGKELYALVNFKKRSYTLYVVIGIDLLVIGAHLPECAPIF